MIKENEINSLVAQLATLLVEQMKSFHIAATTVAEKVLCARHNFFSEVQNKKVNLLSACPGC